MIESGHLPRSNPATLVLLSSIEESLDNCGEHLSDWTILAHYIEKRMKGTLAKNVEAFANWADDILPDWVIIDNEIHYALNFKMFEVIYYICQGFCEAHADAEHKLATFFGDSPAPDTPEEIEVCLESCMLRDKAHHILGSVDPKLVEMIKTKIVAENLLELEYVVWMCVVVVRGAWCVVCAAEPKFITLTLSPTLTPTPGTTTS
jgi:hypothetical protein